MSKAWDTKGKILEMLGKKRMTLSEMSEQLGLAPSTVNQHIKELLSAGAIRQVYNPYVVKWKYYEPDPDFKGAEVKETVSLIPNGTMKFVGAAAVIIVIAAGLLAAFSHRGLATQTGNETVQEYLGPGQVPSGVTLFSVSDSPTVSNISAVNITVAYAAIRSSSTGRWYTVFNGTKTFDLVTLDNISQALTGAALPAGQYDQFVMLISNATAIINNQTRDVFVPNGVLRLNGEFNISGNSTDWINFDINLERSIHITNGGGVVLLPVVDTSSNYGNGFSLNSSGIVAHAGQLSQAQHFESEMWTNGSMESNATAMPPIPPGAGIAIVPGGRLSLPPMPQYGVAAVRTPDKLVWITNLTNITNGSGSMESNVSINVTQGGMVRQIGAYCTLNGTTRMLSCESDNDFGGQVLARTMLGNGIATFIYNPARPVPPPYNWTANESVQWGGSNVVVSRAGGAWVDQNGVEHTGISINVGGRGGMFPGQPPGGAFPSQP